jgi:hypothetical protein
LLGPLLLPIANLALLVSTLLLLAPPQIAHAWIAVQVHTPLLLEAQFAKAVFSGNILQVLVLR